VTSTLSCRARLIRALLQVRRRVTGWNSPALELRTKAARADHLIPLPADVRFEREMADKVPVELVAPPKCGSKTVILYVPGGGGVIGLHNMHRRMIARICRLANCRAWAVHYRLAPEHPFPAALEDCLQVWDWLLRTEKKSNLVLAGDSIGGNIVMAMMLSVTAKGQPLPARAVCISPVLDLQGTGESFRADRDPAAPRGFALSVMRSYAGSHDLVDPLLSPIHGEFRGLPPLFAVAGGDELVLSDVLYLREKAELSGVDVKVSIYRGMWHLWILLAPWLPEAAGAIDEIARFVRTNEAEDQSTAMDGRAG